jgi:hypothetical protein
MDDLVTQNHESASFDLEKRSKGSFSNKSKNNLTQRDINSMFFEDPEKTALDDDNYNSIQLEEIKMLRQSLNAKNNDIRLIESNMNQHFKTL